ncbi:DUF2243 domain-containing protein [Adhaeribacter aquaticus]|uniref:DUF2243 domain-containing protein n=1 Tax=Adhaeribacter aquaticus TaxID=299567 RepID=UPI000550B7DC|nr:DUF2243 domain-containing protein [Adhaeribacter aquaticus]
MSFTTGNADLKKSMQAAALIGIGIMAGIDEIIFHQILSWHHFYDHSTPEIGLLTDGILHAAELLAIVAGFFWLLDLRRSQSLSKPRARAGFFIGLGGFQLFDGVVDHKVLRVHQIRYVDNLLPYDLTWNIAALLLLLIGIYLWRRTVNQERTQMALS